MKNKKKVNVRSLVQAAVLIAIMLALETTGLGMIRIGILEMTILQFPVIVGAILLGPGGGACLGLAFGLISFWECFGRSQFGVTLLGINPLFTFLVCVPTRTLMGFLCGMIYKLFHNWLVSGKEKVGQARKLVPYVVASLSGALMNTLLFMSTLLVLFGTTDYIKGFMDMAGTENIILFAVWFVGIQGLVEAFLCAFLGAVTSRAVNSILKN